MNFKTRLKLILASVLVVLTVAIMTNRYAQSQSPSQTQGQAQGQSKGYGRPQGLRQAATPVRAGQMSDKERVNSRRYNGLGVGRKLHEIPSEKKIRNGDVDVSIVRGPGMGFASGANEPTSAIEKAAWQADAIVIGTVKEKSSQVSEDETFVFTDYDMSVDQVLKDNPIASVQTGTTITVTAPGGKILLDGRVIQAIDKSLEPFEVGARYVLFLKFIPESISYWISGADTSAQILDGQTVSLPERTAGVQNRHDLQAVIDEIRTAISSNGNKARPNDR